MATAPKPIPVPWESFQPGPTEQIYARGALDRDMSGLSLMMMNAAQMQRGQDHKAYSAGVGEANKMAQAMFAQEQAQAAALERLKVAAGLAKEGFLPSGMPAMAGVMTDPAANDDIGQLMRQKMASEVAKNNASASSAGGENATVETLVSPTGVVSSNIKAKGKDAASASKVVEQMVAQELARRGLKPPANAPYGIASTREQGEAASKWAADRYNR